MQGASPFFSVIIPTRPGQAEPRSLAHARQLNYPPDRLEILVARGQHPSVQRNAALRQARGDLIYFLDDDSEPAPQNLLLAAAHFSRSDVQIVGGPNLCPADAPLIERAFAATMGSGLAFGPSAARYRSIGTQRETSEKELILCNLAARRDPLLRHGGFDEALYPNEENALMDELQKEGGKLVYDPEFLVQRRPRPTLRAFIKMLMTYGRGRAEQFRLHPGWRSVPNMIPALFCLGVLCLAFAPWFISPGTIWHTALLALAAVYLLAIIGGALTSPAPRLALLVAPLIFLAHFFYGLGFWRGLLTRPAPPPSSVADAVQIQTFASR